MLKTPPVADLGYEARGRNIAAVWARVPGPMYRRPCRYFFLLILSVYSIILNTNDFFLLTNFGTNEMNIVAIK